MSNILASFPFQLVAKSVIKNGANLIVNIRKYVDTHRYIDIILSFDHISYSDYYIIISIIAIYSQQRYITFFIFIITDNK